MRSGDPRERELVLIRTGPRTYRYVIADEAPDEYTDPDDGGRDD